MILSCLFMFILWQVVSKSLTKSNINGRLLKCHTKVNVFWFYIWRRTTDFINLHLAKNTTRFPSMPVVSDTISWHINTARDLALNAHNYRQRETKNSYRMLYNYTLFERWNIIYIISCWINHSPQNQMHPEFFIFRAKDTGLWHQNSTNIILQTRALYNRCIGVYCLYYKYY